MGRTFEDNFKEFKSFAWNRTGQYRCNNRVFGGLLARWSGCYAQVANTPGWVQWYATRGNRLDGPIRPESYRSDATEAALAAFGWNYRKQLSNVEKRDGFGVGASVGWSSRAGYSTTNWSTGIFVHRTEALRAANRVGNKSMPIAVLYTANCCVPCRFGDKTLPKHHQLPRCWQIGRSRKWLVK